MAATPYKAISFSPGEILTRTKLNQMTNNEQWLFENRIQGKYSAHGLNRTAGVKMAAGIATFATTTTGGRAVSVFFGGFFSVGSNPVVVCTPTGGGSGRLHNVVTSQTGTGFPNYQGFTIHMHPDFGLGTGAYRIYQTVYSAWIAIGW